MARTLKSDRWLFVVTLLLVGFSVVMVYSASAVQAVNRFEASPEYFLYRQLSWTVLGFLSMLAVMRVDYRAYKRPIVLWPLMAVTVALLIVALFMPEVNGARRWIRVSFINVQPSELAKVAAILFVAAVLERRMHRIGELGYALAPVGVVTMLLGGLVAIEDLGTAFILTAVVITMLFAAGLKWPHLVIAGVGFAAAVALFIVVEQYRWERLLSYFDPAGNHQLRQSFVAIGSGGLFGLGLTEGIQKLFYLPEAHTDFIFAVIAEELGLVGTTLTLACFLLIGWRGIRASVLAPDRFGSLLALGITSMITLQALVNITVVTGLAPTKGLPLPFISSGGSSMVINMIAMGLLLNVSERASATAATADRTGGRWLLGVEA
jgi:cell division protein FtsW